MRDDRMALDPSGTAGATARPIGSARSLLLTLWGDVVAPSGGRAWLGAVTEAMGALGVTPETTRQALRRLVARDLLAAERRGRLAAYQATPAGMRRLEDAADRIYLRRPLAWDGRWRMLRLSPTVGNAAARAALRRELSWLGYGHLSTELWICPWDLGARRDAALAKHDVTGHVEAYTAARPVPPTPTGGPPATPPPTSITPRSWSTSRTRWPRRCPPNRTRPALREVGTVRRPTTTRDAATSSSPASMPATRSSPPTGCHRPTAH
ncbi:MAG: hypothetical protein LC679_08815 [Intrasporangiaceae bacterium]|nr:hypothetical protein [Intrasporangiaceae bacterium]